MPAQRTHDLPCHEALVPAHSRVGPLSRDGLHSRWYPWPRGGESPPSATTACRSPPQASVPEPHPVAAASPGRLLPPPKTSATAAGSDHPPSLNHPHHPPRHGAPQIRQVVSSARCPAASGATWSFAPADSARRPDEEPQPTLWLPSDRSTARQGLRDPSRKGLDQSISGSAAETERGSS